MTPFEEELKRALTRSEPSPDFTDRVLSRIQTSAPKRKNPVWQWSMAAAAALALTLSGTAYQYHEQRVRGLAAKDKLLVAMRIAGSRLQQAQEQVRQAESPEVNQ